MGKMLLFAGFIVIVLAGSYIYAQEFYDNPYVPVRVSVGERFVICLESNPTTGYKWEMARRPEKDVVKFAYSSYKPSRRKRIGGGGRELWVFRAIGRGKTEISFIYLRPWEKGIPPIDRKSFKVVVR